MINVRRGNILNDDAVALVNTVNCVGIMGKGLALAFKSQWPAMYEAYRSDCNRKLVRPGKMHLWVTPGDITANSHLIVNFPTKLHWHDPSKLEWIEAGLLDLASVVAQLQISSIAIPPLGCGLGGLDWTVVEVMIRTILDSKIPDVDVRLYVP